MVVVGGRIYQATHDVPADPEGGNAPPSVNYWNDVGKSLESANGVAVQVQKNTADITELDGVVTAQASSLQALRAAWREDDGEGDLTDAMNAYDVNAAFAQEVIVRATADEAQVQRTTELAATVGDVSAGITELERTVATSTEATAEAITQIRAEVGESKSEIQIVACAQADTDDKLSTMWSVKMQQTSNNQLVAAGFGLSIENDNNGNPISQFLVNANRFAVIGALDNGQLFTPFVVQAGQVFMNQAFIQDGTITNAKIGSFISSTNYVAGVQGWRLNKDGTLEINGVVAGQGRLTITHRAVKVFDGNNRLRVQLGDLTA